MHILCWCLGYVMQLLRRPPQSAFLKVFGALGLLGPMSEAITPESHIDITSNCPLKLDRRQAFKNVFTLATALSLASVSQCPVEQAGLSDTILPVPTGRCCIDSAQEGPSTLSLCSCAGGSVGEMPREGNVG